MPLTATQLRALRAAPFWGLRPGDNMWPESEYQDLEGEHMFDGTEVDGLVRLGLLTFEEQETGYPTEEHREVGEVEFRWRYSLTPAGAAALSQQ